MKINFKKGVSTMVAEVVADRNTWSDRIFLAQDFFSVVLHSKPIRFTGRYTSITLLSLIIFFNTVIGRPTYSLLKKLVKAKKTKNSYSCLSLT